MANRFLPYPPIERHVVVGDRRTAALVAADGTIDWFCVPNYDGDSVFNTLLDSETGGYWRFGPYELRAGKQSYAQDTAVGVVRWEYGSGILELCDLMLWPETARTDRLGERRTVVRRMRCISGRKLVQFDLSPRVNFEAAPEFQRQDQGWLCLLPPRQFGLWTSFGTEAQGSHIGATFVMQEGESHWAVFGIEEMPSEWNISRAESEFEATLRYWRDWARDLRFPVDHLRKLKRSAITVHLLSYAPAGSVVAAPTTSLPERIGGSWNSDYRFAWVRDASLSLALLAMLGKADEVRQYMDWLSGLKSRTESPLQVVYRIDGRPDLDESEESHVAGYRESRPVRIGNHAYKQLQHDSLGYLADCSLIYLQNGGEWKEPYWQLIMRAAEYTARTWQTPDNGIWELSKREHWTSSKVMSWVVLERSIKIAEQLKRSSEVEHLKPVRDQIHAEVLEKGWSEEMQSFRQHYGADTSDAAVLLISVMNFLPADDPRVLATAERIEQELAIDGFVHRFDPQVTPGVESELPLGYYEGAFFPCTFWLATTYAKAGRTGKAEEILNNADRIAGELGLLAEAVDAQLESFRGNTPLLFSHVEYVRARIELMKQKPVSSMFELAGAVLRGE